MHDRKKTWQPWLAGTGLLLSLVGTGCSDSKSGGDVDGIREAKSALQRAQDCDDLLSMLKADAVAKLKMEAARLVAQYVERQSQDAGSGWDQGGGWNSGGDGVAGEAPTRPPVAQPSLPVDDNAGSPNSGADGDSGGGEFGGGSGGSGTGGSTGGEGAGPTGSSNTNTQVEGVDEADFVKVVQKGEAMFLLHGNGLFKLDTWPADMTSLKSDIEIEGSPSEMFVTDDGKAVVFSSVQGYGANTNYYGNYYGGRGDIAACPPVDSVFGGPGGCGGGYDGGPATKITVVDVSGDTLETERELYFQGDYVSSRRYDDVVRAVFQGYPTYRNGGLYIESWKSEDNGHTYRELTRAEYKRAVQQEVAKQTAQIEKSKLEDWLPTLWEAKKGKLAKLDPACDNFFVPASGTSSDGVTHVLTLDLDKGGDPGGVTIMGSAQTVYSNLENIILAQPDYRFDFGFVDEQRTNLHLFSIDKADTRYQASGSVSGTLPPNNAQFGLDMREDVIRIATTGRVRTNPDASMEDPNFWNTTTDNRVFTLKQKQRELEQVGKTDYLGKVNESIQSARFVGDRGYVVTFEQIDPLIVLDLEDPSDIKTLGEIEIPGFSQYMHPLDDTHLITLGTNSRWGVQLQLFDVSKFPLAEPKVFDFGEAGSEGQYNHKAFTFYRPLGILALPLSRYSPDFSSTLQLIKVDAEDGFDFVGEIDHSALFNSPENGCLQCEFGSCYYVCSSYTPEVRRGHFVTDEDTTYVYSFSYAGVIVSDLADLSSDVASVRFPQPEWSYESWYADQIERPEPVEGDGSVGPTKPSPGVPVGDGDWGVDGDDPDTVIVVDAGVATPVVDGGAAPVADAGLDIGG